jgi:predicted flap endonuclease-1-like 5' DNA nuclease
LLSAEEEVVIGEAAIATKAAKVDRQKKAKATKAKKASDDLTKIEGIGKKVAALLADEGIVTYKALAKTSVKKLKSILEAAGARFQIHDPSDWPKQAKAVATGDSDTAE